MALVKMILLLTVVIKIGEASSRKKVFACEGSNLSLSCLPGTTLHFVRANFGRFSLSVCPSVSSSSSPSTGSWSTRCLQPTSLRQLTAQCGGKASCDLKVDSETFGDPCPGTPKYLQLLYSCVDARDTSTASPLLPPWMVALESMRESVVLGPASTTEQSTTTSTSTVQPSTSTMTRASSTSSPPLKRTPEVRRPSMEFLMFIQRKEQQRRQQAENLFLNMPKAMSKAEIVSEEEEDNTILIAATISIVACILILGVTAIVVYRLKKREQKSGQNNVYQISSATSSASSSYMQYSSSTASSTSTPGTDYTYMLGSDGRTYRTVTPLSRSALPLTSTSQHSLLQPVPVLQTWHPANLTGEELYVDIDGQGKQQQIQYQQQISQYQPTANQYQPLGGQYQHQPQTHIQPFLQRHQEAQPHNLEPHASSAFYYQ